MNKTVFITGGARGIGKALTELFYENGYNVAVNYNNSEEEAFSLKKRLPGILIMKGNVSVEDDVKYMIDTAVSHFGKIDVLINNAGVSHFSLVTDITSEEWDRIFDINVKGTFLCTKYASKNMIHNHSGAIVNISSIWGVTGASCESCYSASKGAVVAFTKAIAKELGLSGIRVNCIAPGFIDTDMNKNISFEDRQAFANETPLGRIGTPNEVAETALFLVSDKASFVTGQILGCDGGVIV